jgi:hypothetical protein
MAISLKTAGTWVRNVTDPTSAITIPGTPAAGNRMFLFATWKTYTITTASISGWTPIGTEYADGTTAAGNGTGSMKVMAWYRDWQSGDTGPSIDWSAAPTEAHVVIQLWQKGASETWGTPTTVTGAMTNWTTTSRTFSASAATDIPDNSVVMGLVGIRDDSATMTRPATGTQGIDNSAGSVTWNGNYVESPATHISTTTGQDAASDLGHRFVTTGGSATLSMTGTISAAETGAGKWVIQGLITPAAATLQDDFNDNSTNTTIWNNAYNSSATYSETGGRVVITLANATSGSNYAGYSTLTTYNLTGSSSSVELVTTPSQSTNAQAIFKLQIDANNVIAFILSNGTLRFQKNVAGGGYTDVSSVTYSATDHRWWRIRESGGTTYYDTSSDAVTWTNRASLANPFAVTLLTQEISAGTYQSETSPGTAVFDHFNYFNYSIVPGVATLTTTGYAPTVAVATNTIITPSVASLTTTTYAPTISISDNKSITTAAPTALTTSLWVPNVVATDNIAITFNTTSLTTTTYEPTVVATANQFATPDTATLTITLQTPAVSYANNISVVPGTASVSVTTYEPTVTLTNNIAVTPDVATLSLATQTPNVVLNNIVTPDVIALVATLYAPSVTTYSPSALTPSVLSLTTIGYAPQVNVAPLTGGIYRTTDKITTGYGSSAKTTTGYGSATKTTTSYIIPD